MCIRDRHQHGAAQGGGLLLQTAGVGHHQIAPGHQVVHLVHGQGGNEMDAGVAVQILVGGLLHHGGQVDRIVTETPFDFNTPKTIAPDVTNFENEQINSATGSTTIGYLTRKVISTNWLPN